MAEGDMIPKSKYLQEHHNSFNSVVSELQRHTDNNLSIAH